MKFYIFAMMILSFSVLAESKEIQELRSQIEESNDRLKKLVRELHRLQNLSEEQSADLEFINESFQKNNEGIRYYTEAEDDL